MPALAPRASRFAASLPRKAWWLALVAALALLWFETGRRIARVDALTRSPTWSVDAPQRDASSPTGFEDGQRALIVPGFHNVSYWWIMEAQRSVEEGRLRLRHIDYDTPPEGRGIRRTAPYRWWLIATGWLYSKVSGEPLGYSIERGALFADPLLLALLLGVGGLYVARFVHAFAAAAFVVVGVSIFPLAANFQPGAPDPHSLAWVLASGSLLPLVVGLRQTSRGRRIHLAVAGVFGGLGFWNDATTQAPVLLAIFLGAVGLLVVRVIGSEKGSMAPSEWRVWAGAGALTLLGGSVFEFAPDAWSWSLDSVNPIHALVWWGMGEALSGVEASLGYRPCGSGWRRFILPMAGALAICAWPVVGILTHSGALLAPDLYARELANHPEGGMAPSLHVWLHRPGLTGARWATLLPCFLLFIISGQVLWGKLDRERQGHLVLLWLVAVFFAVLACFQLRWWNLFDGVALAIAAILTAEAWNRDRRARLVAGGAALLFVPGLVIGFPRSAGGDPMSDASPVEAQALVARDFAYWIRKRGEKDGIVLFSTPIFSGASAYYGGFKVITAGDEANRTGFLTAVRIASADTDDEASTLIRSRGVTHVALPVWDPALEQLVRVGWNLPEGGELPKSAFLVSLLEWGIPLWMRPMDYLIPKETCFKDFDLRTFAVGPVQEADVALSRLAEFFLDRGQLREARSVGEALENYPRSVAALGARARIDWTLQDRDGLDEAMERLVPYLSRRAARNLPADQRVSLATLFVQTNRPELARDQLEACFERLDAAALRNMTPSSVVNLVALSRSLGIPFRESGLATLAGELMPPHVRSSMAGKP